MIQNLVALLVVLGTVGVVGCGGDFPLLDQPQVTPQVQASCWWVDRTYLENAIDIFMLDKAAGYTAQQELYSFVNSCVATCTSTGGDEATCQYNCTNCGAALVAEVWR